ncbi:c-type cytochrome [Marinobacter metalliresistant]|uniref:C-type cytochrome n=1 Tax=Marinobacter metalliresistant TaxID=2961995 RepID=A0ABZ2W7K1_9GAMM
MKRSSFLIASLVAGIVAYSAGAAASSESVETGEKLYNSTCVACHGANGKGKLPGVPDFTKSDGRLSKDNEVLVTHIMEGFKSPGSSMAMPAKGGISSLTKEQAGAIVQYMRQAFSGK